MDRLSPEDFRVIVLLGAAFVVAAVLALAWFVAAHAVHYVGPEEVMLAVNIFNGATQEIGPGLHVLWPWAQVPMDFCWTTAAHEGGRRASGRGTRVSLRTHMHDPPALECTFSDGERAKVDVVFSWRVASPLVAIRAGDVTLALETMVLAAISNAAARLPLSEALLDRGALVARVQSALGERPKAELGVLLQAMTVQSLEPPQSLAKLRAAAMTQEAQAALDAKAAASRQAAALKSAAAEAEAALVAARGEAAAARLRAEERMATVRAQLAAYTEAGFSREQQVRLLTVEAQCSALARAQSLRVEPATLGLVFAPAAAATSAEGGDEARGPPQAHARAIS